MCIALSCRNVKNLFCSRKLSFQNIRSKSEVSPSPSSARYCIDLVRKYDYENFLCTLLLPIQIQPLAFAIRAFNIEVARVQDQVSQVHTGQMRLTFWSDTIDKMFNNEIREHPVVTELHKTIRGKKLMKNNLKRLIEARQKPITSTSFRSVDDLDKYAESSVSPIYYMMIEESCMGNINLDHLGSHLGKAQGITNILRSIPHSIRSNVVPIPRDLLVKHSVPQETILRSKNSAGVKDVMYDIASRAKQHLEKARSLKFHCPKENRTLFLPGICTGTYLDRLQRSDFNIFDEKLRSRNNLLHIQLYWNKLFYRY